ncbi:YggS family pyridoxal phosphate-dependent enzyme, partial [bacterium]|nr:YggS family pyridoxal phosphate-dependent enzyme [bacterium]
EQRLTENKIMGTVLSEKIESNLEIIKNDIKGYNAKIVAVTKYYGKEHMVEAWKLGLKDFGESRVIESIEKINGLDDEIRADSNYHFIGHLQRNKAKKAIGVFGLIHSLDTIELAEEISKVAKEKGIVQNVLVQVNNSFEETKYGIAPSQIENFLESVSTLENIKVVGLMDMAPIWADEKLLRKLFSEMRELKEKFHLKELSMGMSNDYKIAVSEGATIIRIGRKLFE